MVQKFLDAVRNDPKAQELAKAMPAPKNDTEAVDGYFRLAKKLGYDLTVEEIISGLKSLEEAHKAQSEKVTLDLSHLENVAGGIQDARCASTFDKGEWCWFSDSCDVLINGYDTSAGRMPARMEFYDENGDFHNTMVTGDEVTGDTVYTEAYKGCEWTAVDELKTARLEGGYIDL